MKPMQKRSLPQIPEKRLKTQQSMNLAKANIHKMRRFTYNYKNSISNNEYLKNWLQKDQQRQKIKKILNEAHNANSKSKLNSLISSKKARSLRKDTFQWRLNSQSDQPMSEATIQSHIIKHPKFQSKEPATDEVQIFFNLEIKTGEPSKQKLRNFCLILEQDNILFQKMGRVINQTLLKIGVVNTYSINDYVYKEAFPIKNLGIILWGSVGKHPSYIYLKLQLGKFIIQLSTLQVVLKYKRCKTKFNCRRGNTIGEELIFQRIDYNTKKFSTVQNGRLLTNERCKVVQDCGILFVGEKDYSYMYEDLVKWGFKDQMNRFQNILHRNYFKKRQFKSLMN